MKHTILFFATVIVSIIASYSQETTTTYRYQYNSKEQVALYSFIRIKDSIYIVGHLKEKKTDKPIADTGITVVGTRYGTVSDPAANSASGKGTYGDFKLFLPHKKGIIAFELRSLAFRKMYAFKFEMEYDLNKSVVDRKKEDSEQKPFSHY